MMAELQNGPIDCGIQATDRLEFEYEGELFFQYLGHAPELNHAISVVGYSTGTENGDYWIVRNSWGTYWGDGGFFYLTMDPLGNLGIDLDCNAGTVTYIKPVTSQSDIVGDIFI